MVGAERRRVRLTVPDADAQVWDWMDAQANLSFSIRCLIKEYIRKYGISDATCVTPMGSGPGRPTKEETLAKEMARRNIEEREQRRSHQEQAETVTQTVAEQKPVPKPEEPKQPSMADRFNQRTKPTSDDALNGMFE